MAVTLNASLSAGLVQTADTSGNLSLQSGGTTILALTSAGAAVTGTLSASGATTLSGNTAITGTLNVNSLPITPAEGTWTPIDSSGASLSLTYALGKYKKVGSIVWYSFQCAYPATASAALATIGGLPFTAANTGPDNVTATMQTNGSTAAASSVNQNATTVSLQIASTSVQFTNTQLSTLFIRASGFYFTT